MTGTSLARPEQADDAHSVRALLCSAFSGAAEADLVERLRAGGEFILALAAEQGGEVVGYVAFPRLTLALGERRMPVAGLAPLAVRPDRQRTGIGTALVEAGIARLKERAECLVFVLGNPAYYRRFGFSVMDGFAARYAGPYFQTLRLTPEAPMSGQVSYPAAFAQLG